MKRLIVVFLLAALFCACTATPKAPVVEPDARVTDTPEPVVEDVVAGTTEAPETQAPETEAPETETPQIEAPEEASFAARVVKAWDEAGLLNDFFAYNDADTLDMYGIDLGAVKSGAVYVDAVGYTREAIVIEADETQAIAIEQLLREHLEARKTQFRSYDAEAYALTEDAILLREDGVVLFLCAPEAQAMKAAFDTVRR